nr:tetratricopeptide repeat protein [uncultured Selenomonas sp.]
MPNELQIIPADVLTVEDKTVLAAELDRIIAAHRNNRQDINRLVFESVAAMTTADEAASELFGKSFLRRLIGGISGDNQRLQNVMNSNHAALQYAHQEMLQRIAEQNLMSFDLITAVNNKLNASMTAVGEEFRHIYEGLGAFLRRSRSELVRLETRLEKVERNVNLLTWQNSIEYQTFDGCDYADLDDASKIVCLTRDFYEITKGDWTTSDLLLLKTAMTEIDIRPKDRVNYFSALKEIAGSPALRTKLLGGAMPLLDDPAYLIAFGTLQKLDRLQEDEAYVVSTVADYLGQSGVRAEAAEIRMNLTEKYMRACAGVALDTEIECYDFILDLLFNLRQTEQPSMPMEFLALTEPEEMPAEEQTDTAAEEASDTAAEAQMNEEELLHEAERLYLAFEHEKAFALFEQLAEAGNGRAMYFLGEYYANGYYVAKNKFAAYQWRERGAEAGDVLARLNTAYRFPEGSEEREEIIEKSLTLLRLLAIMNDVFAEYELADVLYHVEGERDEAQRLFEIAAEKGHWGAMNQLGNMLHRHGEYQKANEWHKKAGEVGYDWGWYNLGNSYEKGEGVAKDVEKALACYERASNMAGGARQHASEAWMELFVKS